MKERTAFTEGGFGDVGLTCLVMLRVIKWPLLALFSVLLVLTAGTRHRGFKNMPSLNNVVLTMSGCEDDEEKAKGTKS
jgi:hypothetical protein